MAMEALTYDRAASYKDEFPPDEYETWQPRKVMSVLLEIDPMADKDSVLAFAIEKQYGVPESETNFLGSEKVLGMTVIRRHYDALGSFLHVQSLKQVRAGEPLDFNRMRARCEEIASFIEEVLASPIFNVTLGNFSSIKCAECGSVIRKRMISGQRPVLAQCSNCQASYLITEEGDGKVKWTPRQHEIKCGNSKCQRKILVWHHELEVGKYWKCLECNGENTFGLAVSYREPTRELIHPFPEGS